MREREVNWSREAQTISRSRNSKIWNKKKKNSKRKKNLKEEKKIMEKNIEKKKN